MGKLNDIIDKYKKNIIEKSKCRTSAYIDFDGENNDK